LGRVCGHDPEAWSRLTKIYGPLVYRWARKAGLNDSDAADIGQEVFRTVVARIDSFQQRDGGTFRGWLWTITRNKLGDYIRRAKDRPQAVGGTDANQQLHQLADELPEDSFDAGDAHAESQLMHRALKLIEDDFGANTWQAFWRATIDGHSAAEIAADLGMSPEAVRQAKFRVLRRLRTELDQLID
jgi:RNA polymerase sigma-70 factor (ECF subfamily)